MNGANSSEEYLRMGTAWLVTLLVHVAILLLPVSVIMVSDAGNAPATVDGYFTGLVELSGSPNGAPGAGSPGSGREGGGSAAVTVAPAQASEKQLPSTVKPAKITDAGKKLIVSKTLEPAKQPVKIEPAPPAAPATTKTETAASPATTAKTGDSPGGSKDNGAAGGKGGSGSGSGSGTGSGTGPGNGSGEGSGSGQGSGNGSEPGSGSGPVRRGLGNGQGTVVLGPPPLYPKDAQNEGVTGTVRYHISVAADGRLLKITVLQSSGDKRLDAAALRTVVHRWKFQPAEAPYYLEVEFVFAADGVHRNYIKADWEDEK